MKIYFATWLFDKTLGAGLYKHKANNQLVSYHFLNEQGVVRNQLIRYIKTGCHENIHRKKK